MKNSLFVASLTTLAALGILSAPTTALAKDGACSFAAFDQEFREFTQRYPNQSNWGTRDTYQYAYFLGSEGLKILQEYRSCMSDADFAANYQALANTRNNGRDNCPKFSSTGGNCQPSYPGH